MKIIILTISFLLILSSGMARGAYEIYSYRDPVFPDKRISIDVTGGQFLIADVAVKFMECDKKKYAICLKTKAFSFLIPKKFKEGQKTWSDDEIKYAIESIGMHHILGWSGDLMRIRSDGKDGSTYFLYSKSTGLIAISFVDAKTGMHATYLLDGKCGFGAEPSCY